MFLFQVLTDKKQVANLFGTLNIFGKAIYFTDKDKFKDAFKFFSTLVLKDPATGQERKVELIGNDNVYYTNPRLAPFGYVWHGNILLSAYEPIGSDKNAYVESSMDGKYGRRLVYALPSLDASEKPKAEIAEKPKKEEKKTEVAVKTEPKKEIRMNTVPKKTTPTMDIPQFMPIWSPHCIHETNRFEYPISYYDKMVKSNPNSPKAYYDRGAAKYWRNDNKSAVKDFDTAIKLKPNYAEAYFERGCVKSYERILGAKSNPLFNIPGALADFNMAIKLKPDYAEAYNERAFLKESKYWDYKGAIADYGMAIKFAHDTYSLSGYINNRANAKYEHGDYKGAIADYGQAIKLSPFGGGYSSGAYNCRGLAKYYSGDYNGATQDFALAKKFALR